MKHWKPEDRATELRPRKSRGLRLRSAGKFEGWATVDRYSPPAPARRRAERSHAVAGLAMVALGCVGVCLLLYQLAGPRDTFAG